MENRECGLHLLGDGDHGLHPTEDGYLGLHLPRERNGHLAGEYVCQIGDLRCGGDGDLRGAPAPATPTPPTPCPPPIHACSLTATPHSPPC
jgi:hypothetical protein